MSYRLYVKSSSGRCEQFLGNNDLPEILRKALNKQGAKIYACKDYCFTDFEIKDLQAVIEALEQFIINMDDYYRNKNGEGSIANFTKQFDIYKQKNLTQEIEHMINNGYLFCIHQFLEVIKDDYETEFLQSFKIYYKIKKGHHIYISGY